MLTVTKKFNFAYAHKLPGYLGKCKNLHGHTGVLEVTISGQPIVNEGVYPTMICDFGDLKEIVEKRIIDKLDHQYINDILEHPTAEAMAEWIWEQLSVVFGENLIKIRVYETPTSYAERTKD